MQLDRRTLLAGLSTALLATRAANAASVSDGASRAVPVPARVERVFPAGPPAAILLYTLAPELLIGWPRTNRPEEREFLLPDVGGRPEVGRITGRGNTANLEVVLALKPDLILDVGPRLLDRAADEPGIEIVAGADQRSRREAERHLDDAVLDESVLGDQDDQRAAGSQMHKFDVL
jgi:iron complex transport system substrate-binding protein